jgi:nitrate reductase beta subunit
VFTGRRIVEEILGGEFSKRSQDKNFDNIQKDIYGQFEHTFMMYPGHFRFFSSADR